MNEKILFGQSIIDIAMQYCGDASRCLELAELNGISLTDGLVAGNNILTAAPALNMQSIVNILNRAGYEPCSNNGLQPLQEEGIGFWYIQQDFKVS